MQAAHTSPSPTPANHAAHLVTAKEHTASAETDDKNEDKEVREKRSDKYYNEKGDLQITTSDGVVFRLEAWRLYAASETFRATLQNRLFSLGDGTNTLKRLEFTDPDFENSEMFENVLHMIHHQANLNKPVGMKIMTRLWQFGDKWNCKGLLKFVTLALRSWVGREEGVSCLEVFILASKMDDVKTAALAIRSVSANMGQAAINEMNPSGISWARYRDIPDRFYWSWTKAAYDQGGWNVYVAPQIADRFLALMAETNKAANETK